MPAHHEAATLRARCRDLVVEHLEGEARMILGRHLLNRSSLAQQFQTEDAARAEENGADLPVHRLNALDERVDLVGDLRAPFPVVRSWRRRLGFGAGCNSLHARFLHAWSLR